MPEDATSVDDLQTYLNKQQELINNHTPVEEQCQLRAPSELDRIKRCNSGVHGGYDCNS
jgi:hypothetical protein